MGAGEVVDGSEVAGILTILEGKATKLWRLRRDGETEGKSDRA